MATSNDVAPNSVGWHILEGYPWWPVYICDATKLRPKLHLLGAGHKNILRKARDFPKDYRLVYFFGSHDFQQVRLNKGIVLKPWDCAEKENFLKGHPKHLIKKKSTLDELQFAIQEAEDYLSTPDDIRLPPCMVPSDLDPTLEPPPEIEREEHMENDDDAGDEDAGSDHEDGGDDQDDNEDEDMSGGSDNESKSKSKKKSSSTKKPVKEKKPTKEKKAAKEKKPTKEKKTSSKPAKEKESSASSSKDKKEKKASAKKDKEPTGAASQEDKKRKKPATADDESSSAAVANGAEASPRAASPSKVAKKEKTVDVKSDAKPSKAEKKAKSSGSELSGEALSAVLEKEIKWILANCQFEEMTTKTVRKLLEKRLNMDLRHHKASIKEGVARVIASMEDGTDGAAGGSEGDGDVAMKSEVDAPEQPPAQSSPAPPAPPAEAVDDGNAVKEEVVPPAAPAPTVDAEPEKQDDEPEPVADSEEPEVKKEDASTQVAQRLADAERELELASNDESKLVKVLTALEQLPTVEKEALVNSTALVAKLVELRGHEETSVSKLVALIAKQWDAEDLVPAPKPIREEDILEMKEKLENAETSHEDMLACLNQLAKMRLQMSHLKNTGIARAVANLRQHANDKVSIAAINLRKSWIQLTKLKTDTGSDVDRVKSLESMNCILEQKDNQEGESSHLAVLEKLQGMTLSTQDIIKSKIGVVVSKLRKSSNEKVAKAATLLRKKWKAEAAA